MKRLNFEVVVIALVVLFSVGHVGHYLASYELSDLGWLGYVGALLIDLGLAIAAYRFRRDRWLGGFAFLIFAVVSGVLNYAYYERANPEVNQVVLVTLGFWAPVAAVFLSWLKANADMRAAAEEQKRLEAERTAEQDKERMRLQQDANLQVRLKKIEIGQVVDKSNRHPVKTGQADPFQTFREDVTDGRLDITDLTGAKIGQLYGVTGRTGQRWLASVRDDGHENNGA